jgi:hypothetical protein
MMTSIFIIYVGLVVFSTCLMFFFYDPKLLSKSKIQDQSAQDKPVGKPVDKPVGKPGDWMVKLVKPREEIIITECKTEGEAIRKIIQMEYLPRNIKEIRQL